MSQTPSHKHFEAIQALDDSWMIFDRITRTPAEAGNHALVGLDRQTALVVERHLNIFETSATVWLKFPSGQIDPQTWTEPVYERRWRLALRFRRISNSHGGEVDAKPRPCVAKP